MTRQAFLATALTFAAFCGACGSDPATTGVPATCTQNDKLDSKGKLDLRDANKVDAKATPYLLDVSGIATGQTKDLEFTVDNAAEASLAKPVVITGVDVAETDENDAATSSHQFQCLGPDGQDCAISVFPAMIPVGFDSSCAPDGAATVGQKLTIRYTRPPTAKPRHFKVSLHLTGDPAYTSTTRDILVDTAFGTPKLSCTPTPIDFGVVSAGSPPAPLQLTCSNVGTAPVQIFQVELDGTWYGAVSFASQKVVVGTPQTFSPGLAIEAGGSLVMDISLDADKATLKQGATLVITSNDPSSGVLKVTVTANSTGPCLSLAPIAVDLGSVGLGQKGTQQVTLTNCGLDPINVTGATLQPIDGTGLDVTSPGGACGTALPSTAVPWVLQPKASCAVQVEYAPAGAGVTATGTLEVDSDAGAKTVPVTAKGVAVSCGSACFTMKNKANSQLISNSVTPQTTIVLDGGCSTAAPNQTVGTWNWTVQAQPQGSYASFLPAKTGKTVTFQPTIAGTYTIQLDTIDSAGAPGCQSKTVNLIVVPDDKLHTELTWTTAGDPNPTDTLGTDMDLHLAHPNAVKAKMPDADGNGIPDPWGNLCDCFVNNPVTTWGDPADPTDDAILALDDRDGWGPENININTPQTGFTYAIGVRYWFDKPTDAKTGKIATDPSTGKPFGSMGPSIPRVRIYLDANATPAYDLAGPSMVSGDMWCVGEVTWHKNAFAPCTGADAKGVLLTHFYPIYPATLAPCN